MTAGGTEPTTRPWLGRLLAVVAAAGLIVACAGAWRAGLLLVGITLAVAAALRLFAPGVRLGSFAVRAGWLDAACLGVAAGVLLVATVALS